MAEEVERLNSRDIVEWSLRNDFIVLKYLAGGVTQEELATEFGVSRNTISDIINHPRAREVIDLARAKVREKLMEDIEDQLDLAAKASLKVIKRTLKADISPVHKAKANQDRVALKVLQGRGFLNKERTEGGGLQFTEEQFGSLMKAIQKSDEARLLHAGEDGPIIDAEVEDADTK